MTTAGPRRIVILGTATAALLLLLAAPTPAEAVRALRSTGTATDPIEPLVALLSLVAWALAAWLALTVLVTAGAHLPGLAGRVLGALSDLLAPAAVRRTVEVALGLTVAVGVLGASPAAATPADPAAGPSVDAPAATPNLDWSAAAPAPSLDWAPPAAAAPGGPDLDWAAEPAAPPAPGAEPVVVQSGDTPWGLAEQQLTQAGGTAPTDAEVAQAWPSWWAANRDAIGDDPDLLHPGTPLAPPPVDGSTPPASS